MKYISLACFLALSCVAQAQPLKMLTEEYPPFSYREGDTLKGISVDQVKRIMDGAGIDYSMEMQPWARAFSMAESTPDTCVFTTGMLPDRMPRFKWVQPLVLDLMILVRKAGNTVAPTTIEEAKRYTIGVHKDDSAEIFAKQQGFPRLDSTSSLDLSVRKLLSDRIDLMIMARTTFESLRQQGQPIEAALNLEGTRAGIACNRDLPDVTIGRMQAELDKLIADGTQATIFEQYNRDKK